MSVYILSVLSKKEFNIDVVKRVREKIQLLYPQNKVTYSQYNYHNRKYKELDFDIHDIMFHKDKIDCEIDRLIQAIVIILNTFDIDCEVIGGYNDTENAILQYEENREKNYKKFGLFGTKNFIPAPAHYYRLNDITIYQSFEFDSMGVMF